MTGTCLACQARLRSSRQYLCRACLSLSSRAFQRLYPYAGDPSQHQRNVNAWGADLDARIAAIRAERGLVGVGA